jgi:site-specific DNA-methyltransferase (adenine-specific)
MLNLIHGDCLEVMKTIPDASIDAIITDPPYGTTACKWDSVIPLNLMWEQLKRIIKPNGAIVLFSQTPFDKVLGFSNLQMLRYEWIWEKEQGTGGMNANKMPLKKHENILVFYKKLPMYNPQFTKGQPYSIKRNKPKLNSVYGKTGVTNDFISINEGKRFPTSILQFNKQTGLHPTQKPILLLEYLIKTYTNENETVLDFTMGSGTTGVACKNLNRNFIGIELDKDYFEIATARINA